MLTEARRQARLDPASELLPDRDRSLWDRGHSYGIHEVAERLGHDPGTLMRYYTRVGATRHRQAAHHIVDLITSWRSPAAGSSASRRSS